MGRASTLGLCAVVILAVQERPGRRSSEGLSRVTTTLKSLASSVPVVDCEVATPVERSSAWSPTRVTWPLKTLLGKRVDGDFGGLAELDIHDVGLVDLDLGGDDAHVGEGHEGRSLGVLDAVDDGLAFADRLVGDDAVKGRDGDGAVEQVLVDAQGGDLRSAGDRAPSRCWPWPG